MESDGGEEGGDDGADGPGEIDERSKRRQLDGVRENQSGETLTTDHGVGVSETNNSLKAGQRGPTIMEDFHFREKMTQFDHESIPERVVHARGTGAHGYFQPYEDPDLGEYDDVSELTKASLFQDPEQKTPVFVRFSTVVGSRGSADTVRDVRGFATKFYTEDGNWDLVGNNTPVFFVRDPFKFAMFIHSQKRHPQTNLRDGDMQWDFWSLCPESLHQVTWLFGDRGIPKTYRHINGYGSHTYSLIDDDGQRLWVKFHFKTQQGIENLSNAEAAELIAQDRESHQRDLFHAIEQGDYPQWKLKIQVMTQEEADAFRWNPFDLTKVWPHADFPLIDVGVLELNRNPDNYFHEVEQAAFNPNSFVPGIGPSPDKMLQARLMSYADTQAYRLGVNHDKLDVNRPRTEVNTYTRDGFMAQPNPHAHPNYHPNSVAGAPQDAPDTRDPAWELGQVVVDRWDAYQDHDDYTQAGDLYRMFDDAHRDRVAARTAEGLSQARTEVQERWVAHLYRADEDYGHRVERALAAAAGGTAPEAAPAD
jgi:catalase